MTTRTEFNTESSLNNSNDATEVQLSLDLADSDVLNAVPAEQNHTQPKVMERPKKNGTQTQRY